MPECHQLYGRIHEQFAHRGGAYIIRPASVLSLLTYQAVVSSTFTLQVRGSVTDSGLAKGSDSAMGLGLPKGSGLVKCSAMAKGSPTGSPKDSGLVTHSGLVMPKDSGLAKRSVTVMGLVRLRPRAS